MDKEDIRKKALEDTKESLQEVDSGKLLMKAVKSFDELKNSQSKEMELFRDWYSLHFPELEREIKEDDHLLNILENSMEKDELDSFKELAENSNGMDLREKDLEALNQFRDSILARKAFLDQLEGYIRENTTEEMQNLSILLNPLLASRIVRLAGGLEDLAKQPASTIQMLGAEKALFRFLREGGNPPKHGILFEHEYVSPLHPDERGKMARFIANKTAIAARLDQYGDKNKGEELREEARKKFEEIKEE